MSKKHCFSERRGQIWLGPPLPPTSCLKRGYVWRPLSPFPSELISCRGTGKHRVKSPVGRAGWVGWGPRRGVAPPWASAWEPGLLLTQTRLGPEGPPVTWAGLRKGQPFPRSCLWLLSSCSNTDTQRWGEGLRIPVGSAALGRSGLPLLLAPSPVAESV